MSMVEITEPHSDPIEVIKQNVDELIWARQIVERGSVVLNNTWDAAQLLEKMKDETYSSEVIPALEHIEQARNEFLRAYQDDLLWTMNELDRIIASNPGGIADTAGRIVTGVELLEKNGQQVLHFLFRNATE